ncbi:hypothetical protein HBI95_158700 [Parastagonospora nodorum]|nr:hypothetical protein HBH42_242920 [Parastagonospora nodorum]KAH4202844.1 hypothetical protein HBI95_158700 [Parastagonospora nodorum]KAH5186212.1 hypothetical protein HBH68_167710 [Parastagonospora nodorum]KAH5351059.1 hypothetical protein HBI48_163470 [Parastagonospora nodorum]KAH6212615.1 hypothetical protein HBI15_143060 [Parastagonospora nodorum]
MDFQAAASSGDFRLVQNYLECGFLVTGGRFSRSPLSLAASNGHTKIVRLLTIRGRFDPDDADEKGRTPLSWAAGRGHNECVRFLLTRDDVHADRADDNGWTPLSWAAGNGNFRVVKALLKHGADVNFKDSYGYTSLAWAAANGRKDIVKTLLRLECLDYRRDVNKHEETPFLHAAARGKKNHLVIMKRILTKDKTCLDRADKDKRTPLSWAAGNGHEEATRMLLKEKADIRTVDKYSRTPLSWAAEHGHEKVVAILLDGDRKLQHRHSTSNNGANRETNTGCIANIKDISNQAPILYAAKNGNDKVAKLLIDSRTPSTDAEDNDGRTPLSWAAGQGHDIVVDALLRSSRVDMNKKDKKGETALSWAAKEGHRRVVWMLSRFPTIEPNHQRAADKRTPLSLAAGRGLHAIVKELLSIKEIDKDAKDNKEKTALMLAYEGRHEKTMKFLIEGGANLEIRFPDNMTILMLAAQDGNNTLVQLLTDCGADIYAVNVKDKGFNAMRYAIRKQHESVEDQLRNAMQKGKILAQHTGSAVQSLGAAQNSIPASLVPQASRAQAPILSGTNTPSLDPQSAQAIVPQILAGHAPGAQNSTTNTQMTQNAASAGHNTAPTYMQSQPAQKTTRQTILAAAKAPAAQVEQIQFQTA